MVHLIIDVTSDTHEPATLIIKSGVSPEGKYFTENGKRNELSASIYLIIGVDLLKRLLAFGPRDRPTAEEALGSSAL